MIIENNIYLKDKTTFGLGGLCKNYLIPETTDELIEIYRKSNTPYLIAGGSNIIISDLREFENVISLLKFDTSITNLGNGLYKVGGSVRNQSLINKINSDGYGGIEYLYSVPGTIGGAIYMNAGTGVQSGNYISNNVVSVKWFNGQTVEDYKFEDCNFSYRYSCFQEKQGIIVSAILRFYPQDIELSNRLIQERISKTNMLQDHSGKTCGTLCKTADKYVIRILRLLRYGDKKGIHFSTKTLNWIVNSGEGTYSQFKKCVDLDKFLHKLFRKPFALEVKVWE